MLVCNAFVLHKKFGLKKPSHYIFRKTLVRELIDEVEDAPRPAKRGCKSLSDPPSRLTERHFRSLIPAAEGSSRTHGLRDCYACNLPMKGRIGFKKAVQLAVH